MKILAITALLLASCVAGAQDYPRFELSTGYAYGRVDNAGVGNSLYAQGFVGGFAVNVKSWAALEATAGGQYNRELAALAGTAYNLSTGYYSFMGGPRLGYRGGRAMPFVHGLFGIARCLDYSKATFNSTTTTSTVFVPYQNVFGAAVGGGVDYQISRHLAFRTQGDFYITQLTGNFAVGNQNNFRAAAGFVYSFGRSGRDEGIAARTRPVKTPQSKRAKHDEHAASPVPQPVNPAPTPATVIVAAPDATSAPAPASVAPQPVAPAAAARTQEKPAQVTPPPAKPAPAAARSVNRHPPAAPYGTTMLAKPAPPRKVTQRPPTSANAAPDQSNGDEEPLGDIARRYRMQKHAREQREQQQQNQQQQNQQPPDQQQNQQPPSQPQ